MIRLAFAMVVSLLLFCATDVGAVVITIEPGTPQSPYAGRYRITDRANPHVIDTGFLTGSFLADLPEGPYDVDTGAEAVINGFSSAFSFSVDASGQVGSVTPASAAVGTGTTLHINTVAVFLNPNLYTGQYFVSPFEPGGFVGTQTVMLVPGLLYVIDNGSHVDGSAFGFAVDAAGDVTSFNGTMATGTGNALTINAVSVTVSPVDYTGSYRIGGYFDLTGTETIEVIPGLATTVLAGFDGGLFVVDATGALDVSSLTVHGGGGALISFRFMTLPAITVASVTPNTLPQGATRESLTVTGTNFTAGASVSFSGTGIVASPAAVISSTQLTVVIDVASTAPAGFRDATVSESGALSGTGTGLLSIVTRSALLDDICGEIASFAASGQIATPGISTSLLTSCHNVQRLLGANNAAARGMLASMANRLGAFVTGGKVTPAARDALVADIDLLLSSL